MTRRWRWQTVALAGAALLCATSLASADEWNNRTELTFSEPVLVPGATLAKGTYVFELGNDIADRQIVHIFNADQTHLIATVEAVPVRRRAVTNDVVLKFAPTSTDVPVALKAWYYPDSLYGHEFIYPAQEARRIARQTKTVVLSTDVPNSDARTGHVRIVDASGAITAWAPDPAVAKAWARWRAAHPSAGPSHQRTTQR